MIKTETRLTAQAQAGHKKMKWQAVQPAVIIANAGEPRARTCDPLIRVRLGALHQITALTI